MNKDKLLRLYKDFTEGKFITPFQRKVFEEGLNKLQALTANSKLKMKTDAGDFVITPVVFEQKQHPRFITDVYDSIISQTSKSNENDKQFLAYSSCAISCLPYIQAYKKSKILNEHIYVVTDKVYKTFSSIELPDITFKEIRFKKDLPALFLFEEFNTVAYLDNYFMPFEKENPELFLTIFGYNDKFRFEPSNMLMYSKSIPPDIEIGQNLIKDFMNQAQGMSEIDRDIINRYGKFFYNLLVFLASKDTIKYQTEEYNTDRLTIETNIANGVNVNRNKQALDRLPSYRFVDLNLTVDKYTEEYQIKYSKSDGTGTTRRYHKREEHWNYYWVGSEKDGTRRREPRWIPTMWVGDISKIDDSETTFKVIK